MPAPDFHAYADKLRSAERRADPDASQAQREAGVARVGTLHFHGLTVSIEYPKGSTRRGTGADGKPWSRTVKNAYGYIRGTRTKSDGEQLDVWVGDHPGSQLAFLVSFLTKDGEFDEYKLVVGVRNYAEMKALINSNYPDGFWDSRVGEVRGVFMPELKKHLNDAGLMKKKARTKRAFPLQLPRPPWTTASSR